MRHARYATLAFQHEGIQLTKQEMETLRRASRIAEAARELARSYDSEFEQTDYDTLLGEIEHNFKDFKDGFIPIGDPIYSPADLSWAL